MRQIVAPGPHQGSPPRAITGPVMKVYTVTVVDDGGSRPALLSHRQYLRIHTYDRHARLQMSRAPSTVDVRF
jgi:hypothetical protein